MPKDAEMPDISALPSSTASQSKSQKSQELFTCTIKTPPFAYVHLELATDSSPHAVQLDNLQVRSYCTAAMRQFLGEYGVAVPLDVLKVSGRDCWLRLPHQDLAAFSAAVTAFPGLMQRGTTTLLRLLDCGDWLGSLVGRADELKIWNS